LFESAFNVGIFITDDLVLFEWMESYKYYNVITHYNRNSYNMYLYALGRLGGGLSEYNM